MLKELKDELKKSNLTLSQLDQLEIVGEKELYRGHELTTKMVGKPTPVFKTAVRKLNNAIPYPTPVVKTLHESKARSISEAKDWVDAHR